jgi:hypothetical protein
VPDGQAVVLDVAQLQALLADDKQQRRPGTLQGCCSPRRGSSAEKRLAPPVVALGRPRRGGQRARGVQFA